MAQDAIADRFGQVETAAVLLQQVDDAQALLVVAKSGEDLGQGGLAGVTEGGVAEIVAHADRLDQVLVQAKRAADRAGNLGNLQGMGEAGAVVVAGGPDEDLGLVHQPAEALGVDDPVAVALERGSHRGWLFWPEAQGTLAQRRRR